MVIIPLVYLSNTLLAMYSTMATVKPSAAPPMAQSTSLLLPNICLPLLDGRTWLWLTASSGAAEVSEVILNVMKTNCGKSLMR